MDISATLAEIKTLSVDDRLHLVQEIWDSISSAPDLLELTEAQEHELYSRLADCKENPNAGIPWDEVKTQALGKLKPLSTNLTPHNAELT
jgi:putative addiction module component (TIGR02574 family)